MRLSHAVGAMALAVVLFQPAPSPAQVKVTIGRRKPVTMKDLDEARDPSPLFVDKALVPKVHTLAILTVAGPGKVALGFKRAETTPLLARAETQLVERLRAAGFTVQPLEQTRALVSKEWLSTSIDAMPAEDRDKLQNLSQEEKEAYIRDNAKKLCENALTRALFGCHTDDPGGEAAEGGGGDKLDRASPNTLYLQSMVVHSFQDTVGSIQRHESLADTAGQALGPVSRRVAGELAEKLGVDAVVALTATPLIETDKPASHFGKMTANQNRDFAVETVRIQVVNPDTQFVFAECIRLVNKEALSKKTFAVNYEPDMVLERLSGALDEAVSKEVGHLAGK